MSVINKMLKELDQRHAPPPPGGPAVRPMRVGSSVAGKGKEAFWRLLALLMLAGVVWVVILAFQLQVKPVVTDLALRAAEDARTRRVPAAPVVAAVPLVPLVPVVPAVPAVAVVPAVPMVTVVQSAVPAQPLANPGGLRLAPSIQTQIPPERPARPLVPLTAGTPQPASPAAASQAARPAASSFERSPNPVLEKRERPRNPQEFAEAEFRRGAVLLNDARTTEAMEAFAAALNAERNHESARQALAALLLDQRQIDAARRLLQEGLALNPGNVVFSSSLARILIEGKDYEGALRVLQGAGATGMASAENRALTGAAYQRLGNHRSAMEAYQAALRLSPSTGSSWVGLGISLEALEHPNEAAEAFRRALSTGTLTAEVRAFAEVHAQRK